MAKIIVSWSITYDNIMLTNTNIKEGLSVHNDFWVNLSYQIDELKKEKWWTGLNISHNIALLGWEPILLSSIWFDFIFPDFITENVDIDSVFKSKDYLTANFYRTSDKDGNKLNAFYPWAICEWCKVDFKKKEDIKYWVVSTDFIANMLKNIKDFKKNWAKVFFNPGEQIHEMKKIDIVTCIENTDYLIVNYSEYESIKYKAQLTDEEMIDSFENIIITYWIRGSKIFDKNYNIIEVVWVENPDYKDSTWTWDAYVWWLIFWINEWYSWEVSAQIGAVLSSICSWYIWWQNHSIKWDNFQKLFEDTFWEKLDNKDKNPSK